jgi:hypothetical protein
LVLHAPPNQGFTKLWLDRELGNDFRALRATRDPGALESGGRNAKFRARGLPVDCIERGRNELERLISSETGASAQETVYLSDARRSRELIFLEDLNERNLPRLGSRLAQAGRGKTLPL